MSKQRAIEEWELLNRTINCKHYIGPHRWKAIDDHIRGAHEQKKAEAKEKPIEKKPFKKESE